MYYIKLWNKKLKNVLAQFWTYTFGKLFQKKLFQIVYPTIDLVTPNEALNSLKSAAESKAIFFCKRNNIKPFYHEFIERYLAASLDVVKFVLMDKSMLSHKQLFADFWKKIRKKLSELVVNIESSFEVRYVARKCKRTISAVCC